MIEILQTIADRIVDGIVAARESLPSIVADPRAYPRESMLLAIIVGMAVIFLITAVMLIFDMTVAWFRTRRAGIRVKRRLGLAALLLPLGALVVVFMLLAQLPSIAVVSPACGSCHSMAAAVDTWKAGSHASAGCFGCHAAPGILGRIEGATREVARWGDEGAAAEWLVDSRSCLGCHPEVAEGTVGTSVRVRHSDIIAAGFECVGCHPGVGHLPAPAPVSFLARSPMTTCLLCHDGEIASAECATCHEGRPSDLARQPAAGTTPIPVDCAGSCHAGADGQVCIDCHGLVLPHDAEFGRDHARLSADDPALCTRCHESATATVACGCHPDGQTHGSVSDWFVRHGAQASLSGPGGCRCHDNAGYAMCLMCHRESPW